METNTIAIVNQKGGVGKTTTAYNLAAELSTMGKRCFLIDFDPQANLTRYCGIDTQYTTDARLITVSDVIDKMVLDNEYVADDVRGYNCKNIEAAFLPSSINLASTELKMAGMQFMREECLKTIVDSLKDQKTEDGENRWDYIIIDSLPSLGILFSNVLLAADRLIIPCQTQDFAADGIDSLMKSLKFAMRRNRGLKLVGILPTMTSSSKLSQTMANELEKKYGQMVLPMCISYSTDAQKACRGRIPLSWVGTKLGKKILGGLGGNRASKLGEQYRQLAEYVVNDD